MKRIQFFIPFLLTLFIAAIFISPAQAQTAPTEEPVCRDAAGGVIPCPPTPEPEAPTAVPTSVPADPTTVPTSAPSNPTAVPTSAPTLAPANPTNTPTSMPTNTSMPVAAPTDIVQDDEDPDGSDSGRTVVNDCPPGQYQLDCVVEYAYYCGLNDGKFSKKQKSNGKITVTCKLPSTDGSFSDVFAIPPTMEPDEITLAAAPAAPQPEPRPARPGSDFPLSFWWPCMAGIAGLAIGLLLLPSVQKAREAAARSGQTKEHVLLNKEDGGNTEAMGSTTHTTILITKGKLFAGLVSGLVLSAVQKVREAAARSGQTKEHVLLNKEDGGSTEAGYLKIGDIKGESSDAQADDTPTIKNNKDGGDTERGTKEHILLNKDEDGASSDAAGSRDITVSKDDKDKE